MLTIADFQEGRFKLAINNINTATISELITYYEDRYMKDLLGVDLATEFYADLDVNNEPQTQKFIDIYEPLYFDAMCGKYRSEGMIEMLKGLIYFAIVSEQYENNTMDGNVSNGTEVSVRSNTKAYVKYNEAVANYNKIQYYISQHQDVYGDFYGVRKRITSWL